MIIKHRLQRWCDQGLISEAQLQAILSFEAEQGRHGWIYFGFLALGVVAISLGVIALIAANWDGMSDAMKLGADFVLLAVCAGGVYKLRQRQSWIWHEVFLTAYGLLVLASIGLIGQIYHLDGEFADAALFWSVVTLPLLLMARYKLFPFIWTGLMLFALLSRVIDNMSFMGYEDRYALMLISVPLLCLLVANVLAYFQQLRPTYSCFYFWAIAGGILSVWFLDLIYPELRGYIGPFNPSLFWACVVVFIITLLSGLLMRHYTQLQRTILYGVFAIYGLLGTMFWFSFKVDVVSAACNIGFAMLLAMFFAAGGRYKLFNLFLALAGVRFLVVYFQLFGGLAMTGIGLVVSGLVIIGLVVLWQRSRHRLAAWIAGWQDA